MTRPVTYALTMERLVEQVRALAALHILARQGDSRLHTTLCEGRQELLEHTLRDAFVECVMEMPVPAVDVDIDALAITLLTPDTTARCRSIVVERTLAHMVAARALELWASMASLPDEARKFTELVSSARISLRCLLSPPASILRPVSF